MTALLRPHHVEARRKSHDHVTEHGDGNAEDHHRQRSIRAGSAIPCSASAPIMRRKPMTLEATPTFSRVRLTALAVTLGSVSPCHRRAPSG